MAAWPGPGDEVRASPQPLVTDIALYQAKDRRILKDLVARHLVSRGDLVADMSGCKHRFGDGMDSIGFTRRRNWRRLAKV